MPQTYFDLGLNDRSESWRSIRKRRAGPPINDDARKNTFRSALEQAEQQFRAAQSIGYESRALNLFYGVSQAGRALAAVSKKLGPSDWVLSGHGLSGRALGQVTTDLSAAVVRPEQSGSFVRVCEILDSPIPKSFTLGELWPLIVETTLGGRPSLSSRGQKPILITEAYKGRYDSMYTLSVTPEEPDSVRDVVPYRQYLEGYPALSVWPASVDPRTLGWPDDTMHWRLSEDEWNAIRGRLTSYRGQLVAYPSIGGTSETLHPLAVWWVVLYALSMLTRYFPDRWTAMINVNGSEQATAIEYVLDLALDAGPDLLDRSIQSIS